MYGLLVFTGGDKVQAQVDPGFRLNGVAPTNARRPVRSIIIAFPVALSKRAAGKLGDAPKRIQADFSAKKRARAACSDSGGIPINSAAALLDKATGNAMMMARTGPLALVGATTFSPKPGSTCGWTLSPPVKTSSPYI